MNEKIAKIFAAVCVVCAMIAMAACNSGGSDLPADEPDSAQSSEYVGEISESNSVSNAQTTVNDTTQGKCGNRQKHSRRPRAVRSLSENQVVADLRFTPRRNRERI